MQHAPALRIKHGRPQHQCQLLHANTCFRLWQHARRRLPSTATTARSIHSKHESSSCVLLAGFDEQEVLHLQTEGAAKLFGDRSGRCFYAITDSMLSCTVDALEVLDEVHPGEEHYCMHLGRMAYFMGDCQQAAAFMNDWLLDEGIQPAIVAARQPRHEHMLLEDVLLSVREAHARYHKLHQPLQVQKDMQVPQTDIRLVMNAVLDKGNVVASTGGVREDESHVVVLDGLITDAERINILEWLTSKEHDHSGPPPLDKWERACVDRSGDRATWGLQEQLLQALQHEPPQGLLALQSRLATLYPEFQLCHMPAHALSDDSGDDEEDAAFSSFVANAVCYGDPCAFHLDADPGQIPWDSPWVQQHGSYINREPNKPLFVSLLLYLNEVWPDDFHAETLFLDPASGTGLFVQPRPGRVVLADQDLPHRINSPSMDAAGPRYSLVLKLIFLPNCNHSSDRGSTTSSSSSHTSAEGDVSAKAGSLHTLMRPEWGTPHRLGSASSLSAHGLSITLSTASGNS